MNWTRTPELDVDLRRWTKDEFLDYYPECTESAYRNRMSALKISIDQHERDVRLTRPISTTDGTTVDKGEFDSRLLNRIKRSGRNGVNISQVANSENVPPYIVDASITRLLLRGEAIRVSVDGQLRIGPKEDRIPAYAPGKEEHFLFGAVSDTHFGSAHEDVNDLHLFYNLCKERGITTITHSGDIDHGHAVYRGQEFENKFTGLDRRIDHIVQDYPYVEGITTYLVGGNHDENWLKIAGADICSLISVLREDIQYIDMYQGLVNIGPLRVALAHGRGPNANAGANRIMNGYLIQKVQPHMVIAGHWHINNVINTSGIPTFLGGCFEGPEPNLLLKSLNIPFSVIGGWIFEGTFDPEMDRITSLKSEFIRLA